MPATSLDALKGAKANNILKVLDAVVLVAPMSVAVPTAFTADGELQTLPEGYRSIGWVSKDDG